MNKVCLKCLEYIDQNKELIIETKPHEYYHQTCYADIVNKNKIIFIKKNKFNDKKYWTNELNNEKNQIIKIKQKIH